MQKYIFNANGYVAEAFSVNHLMAKKQELRCRMGEDIIPATCGQLPKSKTAVHQPNLNPRLLPVSTGYAPVSFGWEPLAEASSPS